MATSVVGSNYQVLFYVNAGPYVPSATLTAIPTDNSDPVYDITFTPPASGATTNLTLNMTVRNKSANNALYPVIRVNIGWPTGDAASVNTNLTKIPTYVWAADPIWRPLFRINGFATQYGDSDNRGCYAIPYLYGEAGVNGIKSPIIAFSNNSNEITAVATNINVPFAYYRVYDASNNMCLDIVPGTDLPLYNAGIPTFLAPGESRTFSVWVSNVPGNATGLIGTTSEAISITGAVGNYLDWVKLQKTNTVYNPKTYGTGIAGVDLALPDASTSSSNRYYRTFGSTRADTAADWNTLLNELVKSITGQGTVAAAVADLKERQINGLLLRGLCGSTEDLGSKNFRVLNGYAGNGSSNINMIPSCANIFGQPFAVGGASKIEALSTGIYGPNTGTNGVVDVIDWYRVSIAPGHSSATLSLRASTAVELPVTFPHTQGMQLTGTVGTLSSPCTRAQFLNFAQTSHTIYYGEPLKHVILDWENTECLFDLMPYNATEVETLPSEIGQTNSQYTIQIPLFAKWLRLNDATYQALGTGPATQAARVAYIKPLFNAALADMHSAMCAAYKTQVDAYCAANNPSFNTSSITYGVYSFAINSYAAFAYNKSFSEGYPSQLRTWAAENSAMWNSTDMTSYVPTLYCPYVFYNDMYFLGPGRKRDTATQYNNMDGDENKSSTECRLHVYGSTKESMILAAKYGHQVVLPYFSERYFNGAGYQRSGFSYQYAYSQVNHGSGFAADVAKRFIPPGTFRAVVENIKAAGATNAVWWGQVQNFNNEEVAVANFMSRYAYNMFHSVMHPHGAAAYDKPKCIENLPTNLANSMAQILTWANTNGIAVHAWVPNAYRSSQSGTYSSTLSSAIANEITQGASLNSSIGKRQQASGLTSFISNNIQAALTYFSGVFFSNLPDGVTDPWINTILTNLRTVNPGKLMVAVGQKTDMTYGPVSPCLEDAYYMPNCPVMTYTFGTKLQTYVLQNEFDFASHMGRTEDRFRYIIENGDVPVMFNVLPTNRQTGSTVPFTSNDNVWQ